jgi:hypothetical protein
MPFLITFNKPAGDMFFEGENVRGVKIEITDYGCRFLPVAKDHGDRIVPVDKRLRGGYQTNLIEGSNSESLFAALTNPNGYPFFIITRGKGNYMEARPWDGPKKLPAQGAKPEPDRFSPHLRIWVKERAKGDVAPAADFLAPQVETMSVIEADSVRDRLKVLSGLLPKIDDMPFGKAQTAIKEIQEHIAKLEEPLALAARVEARTLLAESSKRHKASQEQTSAPEPQQKAALSQPQPQATRSRSVPSRAAPHGIRGLRPKQPMTATA